ncbi:MAG: hypothetical protein JWP46_4272 [Modestobacter sp.]|nr:hypothetical protein [Modestobacter sp.]
MNCGRFRWSTFASTVPLTPPTPGPSRTANRRASRRKSADRHPAGRAPAGDRRAPTGGPRPRRVEAVVGGIGPADALCEVAPGVHARCDRSTVRPPIVRVSTRSPSQTPCRATDEAAWTPRIALPAVGRRWLDAPCAAALRIRVGRRRRRVTFTNHMRTSTSRRTGARSLIRRLRHGHRPLARLSPGGHHLRRAAGKSAARRHTRLIPCAPGQRRARKESERSAGRLGDVDHPGGWSSPSGSGSRETPTRSRPWMNGRSVSYPTTAGIRACEPSTTGR